jgi:DNA topoisomerase-1
MGKKKTDRSNAAIIEEENRHAAKAAGLNYATDKIPGFSRHPTKKGFTYKDPQGRILRDKEHLARINSLVIPPAWTDVWISTDPKAHLQCTGRDARNRKQYRYHPLWSEARGMSKYQHMLDFGRALPAVRRQVAADLALPGLPREKVLATVVALLERTLIRVGNEEYARQNSSYGLTTLRDGHVKISRCIVQFNFSGKSGKEHSIRLDNCELATIVKNCRAVPGELLFQYIDESGAESSITSTHVNHYLQKITGRKFTAKDFRTWAGTLYCADELRKFEAATSTTQVKRNVAAAIKYVSGRLGNTPAVCRKCYVHPAVIEAYGAGISPHWRGQVCIGQTQKLSAPERALLRFLKAQNHTPVSNL